MNENFCILHEAAGTESDMVFLPKGIPAKKLGFKDQKQILFVNAVSIAD